MNRTDNAVSRQHPTASARGFTLVEMLVAVGLVVLMMSLFATVFADATRALGRQKGVAENDQRHRMLSTLIRSDLRNRTFRDVRPFLEDDPSEPTSFEIRQGYFYIGENDPNNDTDDVLQFTIRDNNEQYFGRAMALMSPIYEHPNQPEFDDGLYEENQTGASHAAEVSYFLRAGVLYRRLMLIREPIVSSVPGDGTPKDGATGDGADMIPATYSGDFWREFDYSAYYYDGKLHFHGLDSLNNDGPGPPDDRSLGDPRLRWGHSTSDPGLPREFILDAGGTTAFIGRFLHEETSSPQFKYPGNLTGAVADPFTDSLTYDPNTHRISEYPGGDRIAEDVVLTNVVAFDIKVWDDAASKGPDGEWGVAGVNDDGTGDVDDESERGWPGSDDGDWRDVGHAGPYGFYRALDCNNPAYCPAGNRWRFDTWHPKLTLPPPFSALSDASESASKVLPLKAIKITIRYYDVSSNLMRDLTIIESLRHVTN